MLIGGLQKLTLIDYPGKIAATVFTLGCNFYCHFCHNPELVDPAKIKKQPLISEKEFFEFLSGRQGTLDGVCITGGEPLLQPDLEKFIKKIKNLGFAVKLDTNGSNPGMLKKLIKNNLIDYISMDIKGPFKKYQEICGKKIDVNNIKKSIEVIKNSGLDYEFRTTIVPAFHAKEDILEMARELSPAKKYFLQQFRPGKNLNPSFEKEKAYPIEKLIEFSKIIQPFFDYCGIRE